MNNILDKFYSPQLELIHRGKVRDSIRVNNKSRLIVVTDRISAFNKNLTTSIPDKGAVLNGITNWWFEQTQDIIPNHFMEQVDPNITLVKEAKPIKVEMIVRAYLTGSMWRGYEKGQRIFSGVEVPDGLKKNQPFPEPILTPTTKDKYDTEIAEPEIIKRKLVSKAVYGQMKKASLALFKRGSEHLADKGIILVDTKYEFGLLGRKLILIDEIHTPDSSRFWDAKDYKKNPEKAEQIDKEFVRQWMLKNKKEGKVPDALSPAVINETSKRYKQIFETITGMPFAISVVDQKTRMTQNLQAKGLIKPGFVAMVMGSASDLSHAKNIDAVLQKYDINTTFRVMSAHKNGERIGELADNYNSSLEPIVVIAIAGRSNGLGGALAANLNVPVINCPPFVDKTDYLVNIHSSMMMPSKTPAVTVVHPDNAALAAIRCLNVPSLRAQVSEDIRKIKEDLIKADEGIN